ncbi:hypothetical protein DM860_014998 [Cuscuta australis]|uniref:Late embryogenesis abundant protein LEA-2 subgroup domain-containing protein n=1 Tax=Cuscuta australis TaxID=267555 RepID=A0A328DEB4_9ASTE|nr:hypothetical protein DM860_014998 [Cuscuta australis]
MASSKIAAEGLPTSSPAQFPPYQLLPSEPQYVIVLPRSPRRRPLFSRNALICASVVILLAVAVFLLWPSEPQVSVSRLRLRRFKLHLIPLSFDITLELTVKVRNRDFYSVDYRSLAVLIGYKGKELGKVSSGKGHLRARASSYVNATLELEGVEVFSDVVSLIEDVAKGFISFDTVTEIDGLLGLLWFDIPLQANVSCEIVVDTNNQTMTSQNCYPEVTFLFFFFLSLVLIVYLQR